MASRETLSTAGLRSCKNRSYFSSWTVCGFFALLATGLPCAHSTDVTIPVDISEAEEGGCLLQQGFAPVSSILTAVSSRVHHHLEVEQPEGGEQLLSREEKHLFCILSVAFFCGIGCYLIKIIRDYEAKATPTTPPWYVDNAMLFEISTITLLSWLSLGLFAFTQVIQFNNPPRHLSIVESLYLSSQIVTTVGYGDLTPTRPEGQFFLACYILVGVTLVAIVASELLHRAMTASSEGRRKLKARRHKDDGTESRMHSAFSEHLTSKLTAPPKMDVGYELGKAVGTFFSCVLAGCCFYFYYPGENRTIWEAFYMSCVTLTTVGFGSLHPVTEGGRFFAIFWMLVGVSCTANMICTMGDALTKHRRELTSELVLEEFIQEMDSDGSGTLDKVEFIKFELVRQGACLLQDIDDAIELFDALDTTKSGEIEVDKLKLMGIVKQLPGEREVGNN